MWPCCLHLAGAPTHVPQYSPFYWSRTYLQRTYRKWHHEAESLMTLYGVIGQERVNVLLHRYLYFSVHYQYLIMLRLISHHHILYSVTRKQASLQHRIIYKECLYSYCINLAAVSYMGGDLGFEKLLSIYHCRPPGKCVSCHASFRFSPSVCLRLIWQHHLLCWTLCKLVVCTLVVVVVYFLGSSTLDLRLAAAFLGPLVVFWCHGFSSVHSYFHTASSLFLFFCIWNIYVGQRVFNSMSYWVCTCYKQRINMWVVYYSII